MSNRTGVILSRVQLKARAKERFVEHRWACIGVCAVVALISLLVTQLIESVSDSIFAPLSEGGEAAIWSVPIGVFAFDMGWVLLSVFAFLAPSFFTIPLSFEQTYYFTRVYRGAEVGVNEFVASITTDFWRKVRGGLWQSLMLVVWIVPCYLLLTATLLIPVDSDLQGSLALVMLGLIIAGMVMMVVKTFAYSCVGYIVRDCPTVTARQALKLSVRLTKGHKAEMFTLCMSFFGWSLLVAVVEYAFVSIGLSLVGRLAGTALGLVLFQPYMQLSLAGFYTELKRVAMESGIVDRREMQ